VVDQIKAEAAHGKYFYLFKEIYCSTVALVRGMADIYHPRDRL